MKKITKVLICALAIIGFAAVIASTTSSARQTTSSRKELQRHDLSIPGREMIQVRVEFKQGTSFPKHTHPGEEIIYVLEGTLEYTVGDQPPVTLKPGDVLFIPTGTVHSVKTIGNTNGAELATYIVEKGKPTITYVK